MKNKLYKNTETSGFPLVIVKLSGMFVHVYKARWSSLSSFVTLLSRRFQFGRWSSYGKQVWFTESHIDLIISFLLFVLFTQFIVDIK